MGGGCGQPPVPSCRMTPAMGEVGPPARPTATSPQAIATPLPRPRTNNVLKKKESFSRGFGRQGPGPAPGSVPGGLVDGGGSASRAALIAQ